MCIKNVLINGNSQILKMKKVCNKNDKLIYKGLKIKNCHIMHEIKICKIKDSIRWCIIKTLLQECCVSEQVKKYVFPNKSSSLVLKLLVYLM